MPPATGLYPAASTNKQHKNARSSHGHYGKYYNVFVKGKRIEDTPCSRSEWVHKSITATSRDLANIQIHQEP